MELSQENNYYLLMIDTPKKIKTVKKHKKGTEKHTKNINSYEKTIKNSIFHAKKIKTA